MSELVPYPVGPPPGVEAAPLAGLLAEVSWLPGAGARTPPGRGDRVRHATHGRGTVRAWDADGRTLLVRLDLGLEAWFYADELHVDEDGGCERPVGVTPADYDLAAARTPRQPGPKL